MPQEGKYGITLREDNSLTIEHYPDAEGACAYGSCNSHGYYHAQTKSGPQDEGMKAWLCAEHIKQLVSILTMETEFKRVTRR